MYNTIINYNDRIRSPLLNENIREAIHKVIEEESDSNNVTADTFGHTSNTQGENANMIFTSDKLDKSDNLVDRLKYLTINDTE